MRHDHHNEDVDEDDEDITREGSDDLNPAIRRKVTMEFVGCDTFEEMKSAALKYGLSLTKIQSVPPPPPSFPPPPPAPSFPSRSIPEIGEDVVPGSQWVFSQLQNPTNYRMQTRGGSMEVWLDIPGGFIGVGTVNHPGAFLVPLPELKSFFAKAAMTWANSIPIGTPQRAEDTEDEEQRARLKDVLAVLLLDILDDLPPGKLERIINDRLTGMDKREANRVFNNTNTHLCAFVLSLADTIIDVSNGAFD